MGIFFSFVMLEVYFFRHGFELIFDGMFYFRQGFRGVNEIFVNGKFRKFMWGFEIIVPALDSGV